MNLIPYVSVWAVLAVGVLALVGYRMSVAHHDDASLDVLEKNAGVIAQQTLAIQRIGAIDRWGKSLTVLTILYGLAIAGVYIAHGWLEATKIRIP